MRSIRKIIGKGLPRSAMSKRGREVGEEQAITRLQDFINRIVEDKTVITVLEAGCGSCSHLHFQKEVFMVGIDISESQPQSVGTRAKNSCC